MTTATISSKGQITIPIHIRREMKMNPGSKVEFLPTERGYEMVVCEPTTASDLVGMLSGGKTTLSIEEINEATRKAGAKSGMMGLGD